MGTWGGLARRSFSSAEASALVWLSGCAAGVVEGSMAVVIESNISKSTWQYYLQLASGSEGCDT